VADGQARLEARARVPAVDAAVGVLRRERPVPAGILAAALAFRLFALLIPLAYVLVAGIGFTVRQATRAGQGGEDQLGDLVVDSIAAVARTSDPGPLHRPAVRRRGDAAGRGRRGGGAAQGARAGLGNRPTPRAPQSAAGPWAGRRRCTDRRRQRRRRVGAGRHHRPRERADRVADDRCGAVRAAGRAVVRAVLGAASPGGAVDRAAPRGAALRGRVPGLTTWPSPSTSRPARPAPRRCTGRWGWRWCCWCRCSCSAGWP
jgi:hypothetical protein